MASNSQTNGPARWIRSLERATALVNPPARQLGLRNAVYIGTGRQHDSGRVDGWLSIKTMVSGTAVWETPERQFLASESSYLILNDRHQYRLHFDSATPVTTFVLFFQCGLVEDVFRCRTTASERLLDAPLAPAVPLEFIERLETRSSPLFALLERFRRKLDAGLMPAEADDWFLRLSRQMVAEHHALERAAALLASGESVTQVCLASGFESLGSFSTLFRRHYGIPPRIYRERKPQNSKNQEAHFPPAA
jgi:hypothetical protein